MIPISIIQLTNITNGILYESNKKTEKDLFIENISIDSRKKQKNSLFIALKGNKYDSHFFVKDAIKSGAIILLLNQKINVKFPQIIVKDTRLAMGKIANWIRKKCNAKIIGITGSAGKTSVKEITASILSQSNSTLYTYKNNNNNIGVALTLFQLSTKNKYVVIEVGSNTFGEIEYISKIINPDSILINNIFHAHLDKFKSIKGVSKEKGEILSYLSKKGTGIFNLDSHDLKNWKSKFTDKQNIFYFSLFKKKNCHFYAKNIKTNINNVQFDMHTPIGILDKVLLNIPGIHNVSNVLAATAISISVGANLNHIYNGILNSKPIKGRLYPIILKKNKFVFDDTYNSNIGSMISAINFLSSQLNMYKVLVIGDTYELGKKSIIFHKIIANYVIKSNLDEVFIIGDKYKIVNNKIIFGKFFKSKNQIIKQLIQIINKKEKISILIKGSRKMRMEKIVKKIKEHFLC
ncbi:MAG: UDP-N-acetylmuramoyl-tripeptide--D-alanyl-D-alanine ligase [Arsenophonus sp.]|nr:MAG: UDP-N-acetylmuramoyl-tripeptide--D-alanyl-D-alanine ligase [Arsenophonus sp.]